MPDLRVFAILTAIAMAGCAPAEDLLKLDRHEQSPVASAKSTSAPETTSRVSTDRDATDEVSPVTKKLPRNLSPKARKLLLRSEESDQPVRLRIEIRSASSMELLRQKFEDLDVEILSEDMEIRQLSAAASPAKLRELAELADVVYIEAGSSFRN